MNYRFFELLSGLSIATAGTEFISIKGDDPISALMVQLRLTGVTGTPGLPADGAVTRIKVVDGSEVIYNTRGIACVPIHFNALGQEPVHFNGFQNGIQNIASFIIPFGRYLYDPEYALDPSKFRNPKIEIEYSVSGMGLGTVVTATIQVYALMFDEKIPTLKGFLKTKEVWSNTFVSSAVSTVELPTDLPIRTIMCQSQAKGYSPTDQFGTLKLSQDNDKHVVFDESCSNLVKIVFPQKMFTEKFLGETNGATQRLHYGYPTYESYCVPVPVLTNATVFQTVAYGPNIDLYSTSAVEVCATRQGYCPNGMIYMSMGNPSDPGDWLKPRPDMDLDLKISHGTVLSSSTGEVIIQQEQLY